jgi:CRISPR-associated protein Cas2
MEDYRQFERINSYRIMWIVVLFDLPTDTAEDRKVFGQFRKELLKDGFTFFQFSVYLRHCPSRENAEMHQNYIKRVLPQKGKVAVMMFTDKQFGMTEIFYGRKKAPEEDKPGQWKQLMLF